MGELWTPAVKLGQVQASGLRLLGTGLGGAFLAAQQAMDEARGILGIVIRQPSWEAKCWSQG